MLFFDSIILCGRLPQHCLTTHFLHCLHIHTGELIPLFANYSLLCLEPTFYFYGLQDFYDLFILQSSYHLVKSLQISNSSFAGRNGNRHYYSYTTITVLKMGPNFRLTTSIFLFTALTSIANAHTWIEQMAVIAPNGTFVGAPGYPRGFVPRTSPSFSDAAMTNLIPPDGRSTGNEILATDPICMSSQQSQTQTEGSPRLQAAAGDAIALRYQENGHVTLPQNQPGKPANRGTVFVYGTTQPSPSDTLLAIHRVWNADQTGGDKRGVLLSSQNFDDGQCYQVNSSPISEQRQQEFPHTADALMGVNIWCQQDIALPASAPSGQPYTLYWVWDWPTAPGAPGEPDGKQELYTTCMDVDIVSSSGTSNYASSGFVANQDLNYAAISSEFAQLSNPTAVAAPSEPPDSQLNGGSGAGSEAGASSGVAVTSTPTSTTFATVTTSTDTPGSTLTISSAPAVQPGSSQAVTPGVSTSIVTEYSSVTQTVFQTIYPSSYQKRSRKSTQAFSLYPAQQANDVVITVVQTVTASSPSPSTSTSTKFELRGRSPHLLRW